MTPNPVLRPILARPEAPYRLFLLPYAGGGARTYQRWAEFLPPEVEAIALQPPGREERFAEPAIDKLEPLAEQLADGLESVLEKPYVIFGHSMGGLAGWELVRRLDQRGLPGPEHLYVSGSRPPHRIAPEVLTHELSDKELVAELHALNGTPPAVLDNDELMLLMLPLLRADFAVVETYDYPGGAPVHCPISALAGLDDVGIIDYLPDWAELTSGAFAMHTFPGGHFYLHDHVQILARLVTAGLHDREG